MTNRAIASRSLNGGTIHLRVQNKKQEEQQDEQQDEKYM